MKLHFQSDEVDTFAPQQKRNAPPPPHPPNELLVMIFKSDYLQLDLFKYAWQISKHEYTHIKPFITKSKTLLWMLDHRALA